MRKVERTTLIIALMLLTVPFAFAQTGYKIDFVVKGWKDTTAYLGHYYGESTYAKDTAKVNSHGAFTFEGKTPLPQGVYFLILNKSKIFDLVIGKDQTFSLETSSDDFIQNMVVKGDEDNHLFFENMKYNVERNKEAEPFVNIVKDSTLAEDKKKEAREGFSKINEKVIAHQNELIANYPSTMTVRFLKATKPITIPDPPKKENGSIDSTFQYRYYKAHFFDYFDLSDDALIRLPRPFYQEKLKEYLDKLVVPQPDSVMKAIDGLVMMAKKNPETYKYVVWNCIYMYQSPTYMGLDIVFAKMYDKYIATGEMNYWISDKIKNDVKDYASKLKLAQIGSVAPNLTMQDQNLQPRSLYDIKSKYTVLFFFNPDCGHCREETPKLVELYNKERTKLKFDVFAVSSDTSMVKMKNFIKEFNLPWTTVNGPRSYTKQHFSTLYQSDTTPFMYVIDDQKKVIAKKLPVENLEDFLTKHEKFQQTKSNQANGPGK